MSRNKLQTRAAAATLIYACALAASCSTDPAFDVVEKEPEAGMERTNPQANNNGRLEVMPSETNSQEASHEQPTQQTSQETPSLPSSPESPSSGSETQEPTHPIPPLEVAERFIQNDVSKLDILWVIDNSGSMAEIQSQIKKNFRQFAEIMKDADIDLQMGVTSTDICSGTAQAMENEACPLHEGSAGLQGQLAKLVNGVAIIRSSSPTMVEDFARLSQVGITGSSFEHGLSASRMAVEAMMGRSEVSLIRPDAFLAIMIVSDEQDDGVGLSLPDERGINYRMQGHTNYYYDAPAAVKDIGAILPGGRFSINAITGTKAANGEMCSYVVGNKRVRPLEEGSEYLRAATLSGGLAESICDTSWAAKFERMAQGINQQIRSFKLSKSARPDSIRVLVNKQISADWSYHAESSSIEFAPNHVPEFGSDIEVRYLESTSL
jgi:hypothetical protein